MEYFQVTKSKFISFEKPVDVYAVVSGAIRGPGFPPANAGSIKSPTVADVVRNPHTTARVIESVDESALEKASETKYTYTYEYDSHHNWIKRITSLVARSNNFRPVQISATYRTITYY